MRYLQEAEIVTLSDADCDKLTIGAIHYSDLCAGVPEGGVGQCIVILFLIFLTPMINEMC
jgi:hypothetical protein